MSLVKELSRFFLDYQSTIWSLNFSFPFYKVSNLYFNFRFDWFSTFSSLIWILSRLRFSQYLTPVTLFKFVLYFSQRSLNCRRLLPLFSLTILLSFLTPESYLFLFPLNQLLLASPSISVYIVFCFFFCFVN